MIRYITIHHTVTPRDNTNIKAIRKDHKKKYGRIWYGKIITPTGTIHEHDEWNDRKKNRISYDIAVTGDFREGHDLATRNQLADLKVVIDDLESKFGIMEINGHRNQPGASKSSCPGKLLEYFNSYKEDIQDKVLYKNPNDKTVWAVLYGERYWIPSHVSLDGFEIEEKLDIYDYPYSGKMALFLPTDNPK